ncbi:MAG: hypothetical protein ACKPKO_45060, partial [Candidatus Fonsibacter sp.]
DDYCPVLNTDYKYFREITMILLDIKYGDPDYSHVWAFPEFCKAHDHSLAAPAITREIGGDGSVNRLDLGGSVFIAQDGGVQKDLRTRSTDGPMWVPEAASCLNSTALVNKSVDRWLIVTGCGYDLNSKRQVASARKWIRQAAKPRLLTV